MEAQLRQRHSVLSSSQVNSHGSGCTDERTEGAKNHWVRTASLKNLTIGTYNTRSLLGDDRLHELEIELDRINWDILGMSEVRRRGENLEQLKNGNIMYTRENDNNSQGGVGILIKKDLAANIISFKITSSRVAQVIIKLSKRQRMRIIQCMHRQQATPMKRLTKCMKK